MSLVVLGIFVADTAFEADRLPRMGETLMGRAFRLGPGGKGSNQAVAAARAGAEVTFITRLGADAFAELAYQLWHEAGVQPAVSVMHGAQTGAAFIFLEAGTGANAIIVCPGAGASLARSDLDAQAGAIAAARVFVTQLEQPLEAAHRGLEIARAAGTLTLLNPAPVTTRLSVATLALCDLLTPNESEAEALSGIPVAGLESAEAAARAIAAQGAAQVVVTLGGQGALWFDGVRAKHLPPLSAGPVVDTTGAGDAFCGGLAAALSQGRNLPDALRFATAAAALSVTRPGAAASMPHLTEIDALLARC